MPFFLPHFQTAMDLAEKGRGYVSPNPVVSALLIREGQVLKQAYHQRFGQNHAERNVFELCEDGEIQKDDVLMVTLEPCCHQGKTPPCTEAIIASGIQKVVVGVLDPNPEVSGKGVTQLREAGIEVEVLEQSAESDEELEMLEALKWQNRFFFKWVQERRPWVALKMAQSLDGRVVPERGKQFWLTNQTSRQHVHEQRAQFDALLVGLGTVLADDPRLTVRDIQDQELPHQPKTIVLDAALSVPTEKAILRPGTMLFTGRQFKRRDQKKRQLEELGVQILEVDANEQGFLHLRQVLDELASRGIASVYVEGGAGMWSSFVQEKLADELMLYTAPRFLGKGVTSLEDWNISESIELQFREYENLDGDLFYNATFS